MILNAVKQNPDEKMLLIDGTLAKRILSNLNNATEELNKKGKAVFLIVAPQIRRHVKICKGANISGKCSELYGTA